MAAAKPHEWSMDVLSDMEDYFKKNGLSDAAVEVDRARAKVRRILENSLDTAKKPTVEY